MQGGIYIIKIIKDHKLLLEVFKCPLLDMSGLARAFRGWFGASNYGKQAQSSTGPP